MLKTVNTDPHARLDAAMQDPIGVLTRIFGNGGNLSGLARERLRRAALDSLKRLVERYLDSPALSAEFVCARSGWSRATVYRLFEPEGGLVRYIRKQRLQHALRELVTGQPPHRRIVDLALAHQFASEATFSRAFRRAFGIPPGQARDLAASSRALALAGPPSSGDVTARDY
ncbi:MAG: helix-turn-helix transcriptional regulator [Steroidobacteraceae bacterium]